MPHAKPIWHDIMPNHANHANHVPDVWPPRSREPVRSPLLQQSFHLVRICEKSGGRLAVAGKVRQGRSPSGLDALPTLPRELPLLLWLLSGGDRGPRGYLAFAYLLCLPASFGGARLLGHIVSFVAPSEDFLDAFTLLERLWLEWDVLRPPRIAGGSRCGAFGEVQHA